LTIKDVEEDFWESDELADYGYMQFGDKIFPLTYLNGNPVMAGFFPEKEAFWESIKNPSVVTKEEIDNVKNNNYDNI